MNAYPSAPGPHGYPLIGHIPHFRHDILDVVMHGWQRFGPVVRYRLGWSPLFVVTDPGLAQRILVEDRSTFIKIYKDPEKPVSLQIVLRNGLVTNGNTDSWLVQRRIIQPMFHRQQLAGMSATMIQASQRMLRRWEQLLQQGPQLDVFAEMTRISLDIINQTMFSVDILESLGTIGPAIELASRYLFERTHNPFSLPLRLPTPHNRRFQRSVSSVDALLRAMIAERRSSHTRAGDLLDLLLEAQDAETGARMSDEQVRDEVATMFAAGHETTANALSWALYLLAQHPAYQQAMQAELDAVLAGQPPTMADLENLPLTRYAFDETLRLYPSTPLMVREAAVDTELGGYQIPAGAHILINVFGIHRDPALWPDPLHFDPRRFTPEQAEGRQRLAYMPFGAGPRMCIGINLSRMEGPLVLAMIMQHYRAAPIPGYVAEPEVLITMRPRTGSLPLHIMPRAAATHSTVSA